MTDFTLTPEPTPRERRVWTPKAGRLAQKVGKNFQEWVEYSAGIHKAVVAIDFLPPFGAKYIFDPKTRTRKVITMKISCDAHGCFCADGVALHFDAKSTDAEKSFDVKTMVFGRDHQYRHLLKMQKANAVSGYLVDARSLGEFIWLDVGQIISEAPIAFAKDGKLRSQWVSLGPRSGAIDFRLLRAAYFPEKKPPLPADLAEMEARGHPARTEGRPKPLFGKRQYE